MSYNMLFIKGQTKLFRARTNNVLMGLKPRNLLLARVKIIWLWYITYSDYKEIQPSHLKKIPPTLQYRGQTATFAGAAHARATPNLHMLQQKCDPSTLNLKIHFTISNLNPKKEPKHMGVRRIPRRFGMSASDFYSMSILNGKLDAMPFKLVF